MTLSARTLPITVAACALLALAGWLGSQASPAGDGLVVMPPAAPVQPQRPGRLFAIDDDGRLVIDQRTRLALAAQLAMNPAEHVAALADAEAHRLPPAAATAARDLARRYLAYDAAVQRRMPRPLVPQAAAVQLAELSALSSLRIAYFGPDLAARMFDEEEALSRRLLEQGLDGRVAKAAAARPSGSAPGLLPR